MVRIGKVIKSYIAKLSGNGQNAQFSSVEELSRDERKSQIFGPINEDSSPPETLKTINFALGRGRGFLASVAYHNENIAPQAIPGERRLYSTNATGDTVMAELFFKQGGDTFWKNLVSSITQFASGTIALVSTLNSIIMSPNGYIGISGQGGSITISQAGVVTITGTSIVFNGPITSSGIFTQNAAIISTGIVFNNGVNIGSTHVHSGVTTGAGNTGVPQ